MRTPVHRRGHEVQSVTTAHPGHSDDIDARQRRYLLMMGIRIACLPLAIVVQGWARWVFIVAAVVLPYIAVVVANAARRPVSGRLVPVDGPPKRALPGPDTPNMRDTA
ncbi:MAG TPA: DUF3099 domain-containing protein [Jiangellaceae bacterium]|nr:DUF3099 domain-containing protein [Jiangellaceae bacterium]